jgi:hypothetical protein
MRGLITLPIELREVDAFDFVVERGLVTAENATRETVAAALSKVLRQVLRTN